VKQKRQACDDDRKGDDGQRAERCPGFCRRRGLRHGVLCPIAAADPTAHAEIAAIRDAASRTGNYRLTGSTLCVTIEPCLMCVGALVHARVGTLVYGAAEPRTGAIVSTAAGGDLPGHNHRFAVVAGIRDAECRNLMQEFFKGKRKPS
jgi:tRNA(adenine34) deaminase